MLIFAIDFYSETYSNFSSPRDDLEKCVMVKGKHRIMFGSFLTTQSFKTLL